MKRLKVDGKSYGILQFDDYCVELWIYPNDGNNVWITDMKPEDMDRFLRLPEKKQAALINRWRRTGGTLVAK